MRRRNDGDDEDGRWRGSLASSVLAALGHGLLLAGVAGIAVALLGPTAGAARSLGTIVMAGGMGAACVLGAFALREQSDTASSRCEDCRLHARPQNFAPEQTPDLELETKLTVLEEQRGRHTDRIKQHRRPEGIGRVM